MERNTKELILTTAEAVLERDGLASVNTIIAEAGLSKSDPALRERLAAHQKHIRDMLWEPGLPEGVINVTVAACIGVWLERILTDEAKEATLAARKELAQELFTIIDQALANNT